MSMGFPAFRGGLIFWADLVGAAYVEKRLNEFAAQVRWQRVHRCRVLSPGAHPCCEGSLLLPLRSHCVPCPLNRAPPPSTPQAGRPLRALRHPAAIVLILCPSPPPSFPSPSPPPSGPSQAGRLLQALQLPSAITLTLRHPSPPLPLPCRFPPSWQASSSPATTWCRRLALAGSWATAPTHRPLPRCRRQGHRPCARCRSRRGTEGPRPLSMVLGS